MKRRCSSSSRVNAWMTRIADIERWTRAYTSLSRSRTAPAARVTRESSRAMTRSKSGQTPSDRSVSFQSSANMIAPMPASVTSAVTAGNRQFIVRVCSASVSAVTR